MPPHRSIPGRWRGGPRPRQPRPDARQPDRSRHPGSPDRARHDRVRRVQPGPPGRDAGRGGPRRAGGLSENHPADHGRRRAWSAADPTIGQASDPTRADAPSRDAPPDRWQSPRLAGGPGSDADPHRSHRRRHRDRHRGHLPRCRGRCRVSRGLPPDERDVRATAGHLLRSARDLRQRPAPPADPRRTAGRQAPLHPGGPSPRRGRHRLDRCQQSAGQGSRGAAVGDQAGPAHLRAPAGRSVDDRAGQRRPRPLPASPQPALRHRAQRSRARLAAMAGRARSRRRLRLLLSAPGGQRRDGRVVRHQPGLAAAGRWPVMGRPDGHPRGASRWQPVGRCRRAPPAADRRPAGRTRPPRSQA